MNGGAWGQTRAHNEWGGELEHMACVEHVACVEHMVYGVVFALLSLNGPRPSVNGKGSE